MSKTYYVDPGSNGHDSYTETQAQSAGTPWKTLPHAIATCDNTAAADANGVSCYIKVVNGSTFDVGAGYLDIGRNNAAGIVVVTPVTPVAHYTQAWTLTTSNTGFDCTSAAVNWRFENMTLTAPAGTIGIYCGGRVAWTGIEFCDCNLAIHRLITGFAYNVSGLTFRRCDLSAPAGDTTAYQVILGSGTTPTLNNLLLEDCTCVSYGQCPWIKGPGTNVIVRRGTYAAGNGGANGQGLSIGNSDVTKSPRNTNVLVEDATLSSTTGNSHVLMFDCDGGVCRRNTLHTGSPSSAGYAIVCKWGFGYQVYGNTVYAESASSCGIIVKGVTEASFWQNHVIASGAAAKCISVYNNDNDSNKKCKNISIVDNRFDTSGAAYAVQHSDCDTTGYFVHDRNQYTLAGSGQSVILGTTVATPETLANITAAWAGLNTTTYPSEWTENESEAYQIPATLTEIVASVPTTDQMNASMLVAIRGVASTVNVDGMTLEQAMKIIGAAVAGKVSGADGSPVFKGLDGVTPRITGTVDALGNRTAASYHV